MPEISAAIELMLVFTFRCNKVLFSCPSSALNALTLCNVLCVVLVAWYYTQVIKGNPVQLLIDLEFDSVA